jgi:lysophospholipase L1-like esterase
MKKVILIGDSIRAGYQPRVARVLKGEAEVWGPQENGGTSRNVLAHLDEWVLGREADIVHLNCGLHDLARDPDENGKIQDVRVPLEEYERNVREILSRIQASGRKICWATTTPVHEENHRKVKTMERHEADIEKYNAAALRVARELNVPVDDLNRVVSEAGDESGMRLDGVHYTEEGSARLGQAVAQFLRAHW